MEFYQNFLSLYHSLHEYYPSIMQPQEVSIFTTNNSITPIDVSANSTLQKSEVIETDSVTPFLSKEIPKEKSNEGIPY